jgi:hypothetical protein
MKFITDRPGEPLILTGNGRGEYYLLGVISQKLDGTSKIYFPYFQSNVLVKIPKTRTTLAVLKSLMVYVEEFYLRHFYIVIDLEHFTGGIRSDIEEKFISMGVSIDKIEMLNPPHENALRIEGRSERGNDFVVMISVMGIKECPKIEYHVAKVIEHQYGVGMDTCPRKEDIRVVLKQRRVRDYGKLIENLAIEEIEKHFPQLIRALRAVEEIIED